MSLLKVTKVELRDKPKDPRFNNEWHREKLIVVTMEQQGTYGELYQITVGEHMASEYLVGSEFRIECSKFESVNTRQ